jgi:hypothetical protein
MAAECESHLQTQYINLHIIWLLYRSINGLEPNAGTTSAFNTSPSFTFDEVFWHELRKAGFYDYHSHGGEKKQIIFEKDSVWSNWIKWPKDPDEEDMNQYVTMMKEGYSAFRIVPLNNATDSILNTLTNSIRMDLKVKEEGFIPLLNDLYWQRNWRWCKKCQSLFYAGNSNGVCPAGDKGHDGSGSSNYLLNYNEPNATGQHKWRWCKKCQTLYYAGGPLVTSTKKGTTLPAGSSLHQCPAGGSHDGSQSGDYIMHKKIEAWGVSCQSHWRWCKKCQTLYYAGGPLITSSTPLHQCPMGGSHDGSQSGHYELRMGSDEKQEMPR